MSTRTNDALNRRPADGASGSEEAVPLNSQTSALNQSYSTTDPCSQEIEQLRFEAASAASGSSRRTVQVIPQLNVPREQYSRSPQRTATIQPSAHQRGRGTTTQTIPSRYVSSPRRLLDLLKSKYGEDGYTVEMRHNTYTVVTRYGRGKLSQEEIQNC